MSNPVSFRSGAILGHEELYRSSNSIVYRGHYREPEAQDRPVVLKLLNREYPSPEQLARFKQEFELTRSLQGAGVISAYELIRHENSMVMVLEDFGGQSLDRYKGLTPMALQDFLPLAINIVEALAEVHQHRVIHKDINPSNIVWNRESGVLKLIDFGLSSELSQERSQYGNASQLAGTLAYLSPEQTGRMNRSVDYRSDFYALGMTFYELLTGQLPLKGHDALEWVHWHIARTPSPPHELNTALPPVLSDIVLKLLAKTAEDRYLSLAGLKHDLQACREQLQAGGRIDHFEIATHDVADTLNIPQKLYGREPELNILLASFEGMLKGQKSLVSVTGKAGIGKSSLVRELLKPIVAKRGFFVEGKFDQLDHNTPYASLVQAFRELIRILLAESDEQIAQWRDRLLKAVGSNAKLIVDVIPELEWIIGQTDDVPALSAAETRNRFVVTFQSFVKVFCSTDHPLVIFLDDVQWADLSSLKLVEQLMLDTTTHHLQILMAYRDSELAATGHVTPLFKQLGSAGIPVTRIGLGPLTLADVETLLLETLQSTREKVHPLAQIAVEKTLGNPYFLDQFLEDLCQRGLLRFSFEEKRWTWDTEQIAKAGITDNVIDLMIDRLGHLQGKTQHLASLAACIGSEFDLEPLAAIGHTNLKEAAERMLELLHAGLLVPLNDAYKWAPHFNWHPLDRDTEAPGETQSTQPRYRFSHDRVQQAAYSLLPDGEKAKVHYQIGNTLLQHHGGRDSSEVPFEVANHFFLAGSLFTTPEDRILYAQIHERAGQRAKVSAAFGPAMRFFHRGLAMLPPDSWHSHFELTLALHTGFAEMAYINGDYAQMHDTIDAALAQTTRLLDQIPLHEIRILALVAQHDSAGAVREALTTLEHLGIELPRQPGQSDIEQSLGETMTLLGGMPPDELANLPQMTDPHSLAAIRIINRILSASYQSAPQLFPILVFTMVQLSYRHGNTQGSTFAYATYAVVQCGILGDYDTGYRFGQLALKLVDQLGAEDARAKTGYCVAAFAQHWKEPIANTLAPLEDIYHVGLATGDFEYAGWAGMMKGVHAFFSGRPLPEIQDESLEYWRVINQIKQQTAHLHFSIFLQSVANLQSDSGDPTLLSGDYYDQATSMVLHEEAGDHTALFIVHFNRLVLCYLMGDYKAAGQASIEAEQHLNGVVSSAYVPLFHFYTALTCLAQSRQDDHLEQCLEKLATWAQHSPTNYEHRLALLRAEQARLSGDRSLAVVESYQSGIEKARDRGFLQDEALGNELLAGFFEYQKQPELGRLYLEKAHHLYGIWGARAKLRQLQQRHAHMQIGHTHKEKGIFTSTTSLSGEQSVASLDLMSVIKASQTLSSEILLERLLQKLMTLVIENAGAEVGYLLLANDSGTDGERAWTLEAKAVLGEPAEVQLGTPISLTSDHTLPTNVLQFVARTREPVVLGDVTESTRFANDPYLQENRPPSILCAPILSRNKILGMIYLENSLSKKAFTPNHLETIQFLASQAAISLENASLYGNLESRVRERTLELNEANKKLTFFATTDSLTRAFNRRHFLELATQEFHRAQRFGRPLVVMMIDIDHFKQVNDTYGHDVGDEALAIVASTIKEDLRDLDIFGRLGGEEFAVLAPETTLEEGLKLAERIRKRIETKAVQAPPHELHVTVSIGLSAAPQADATIVSLLQQADKGLYKAKRNARNRIEII